MVLVLPTGNRDLGDTCQQIHLNLIMLSDICLYRQIQSLLLTKKAELSKAELKESE